jgi:hypothetical protein
MSPRGDIGTTGRETNLAVLGESERAALSEADSQLSRLQQALEAAARNEAIDEDVIDRIDETARETVARVNANLPPQVDADARDEIRRRLIYLLTLRPEEGLLPLDLADRVLMELRDAGALIALLEAWLPSLPVKRLAELLGVSERQVQRRRNDGGPSTYRMQIVARLVATLRHAWTEQGVYAWFWRPRDDLQGASPIELLDDAAHEPELMRAVRAGRVQGGI